MTLNIVKCRKCGKNAIPLKVPTEVDHSKFEWIVFCNHIECENKTEKGHLNESLAIQDWNSNNAK